MAAKDAGRSPKQVWWIAAVAVPIVVAIIAIVPDVIPGNGDGGGTETFIVAGSQFNDEVTFNDFSVVVNQAQEAGLELSEADLANLQQALNLARSRQFAAAIPLLESLEDVAPVPAILNNLGAAHLATGNREAALGYFRATVARIPNERVAQRNLSLMDGPTQAIEGATVVNFSSQLGPNSWAASNIMDGRPERGWKSGDEKFPQTFVIEMPGAFLVSQLSFDNASAGEADTAVRSIELSVSQDAPDLGYRTVQTFTLRMGEIAQGFKLDSPVPARWLKLRVLSNHGNPDYTELMEVRITGKPVSR